MKKNAEEKNTSPTVGSEKVDEDRFITTAEKAQYEVFRNGDLPRETIAKWIGNDIRAIQSFCHGLLNDPEINKAVVDAYYERYKKLHAMEKKDA